MTFRGEVTVDGGPPTACTVELTDAGVRIERERGTPLSIEYVDIVDLFDEDYRLAVSHHDGVSVELSMFGKAYGQLVGDLRERRDASLERNLFLRGVNLTDTFPGKLFAGPGTDEGPVPVQVRLYEDLLVVVPERAPMFGVPFAFVDEIGFDDELYQTWLTTDDGEELVFGHLGRRSEEFHDDLATLLDALARRTAATLSGMGVPKATAAELGAVMRDGRAAQERVVREVDDGAWDALAAAVAGTDDLREAYEHLYDLAPDGWTAFGVKAVRSLGEDGDASDAASTDRWMFCPLTVKGKPVNAVAQEVASSEGHATYVFRITEPRRWAKLRGDALGDEVARGIALLNRALLQLNFRREPLYLDEAKLREGRYARYRVALRSLPYLRWARAAYVGRAVHDASWQRRIAQLASDA